MTRRRNPNSWTIVRLPERDLAESVLALAAPLLERLSPAAAIGDARAAVALAVRFWNASVLASRRWEYPRVKELNEPKRRMRGREASREDAATFDLLAERWREHWLDPRLVESWTFSHLTFRGVHRCSLCAAEGRPVEREVGWSQENLIVPGDGEVFAAPGGISHYIADHEYRPPAGFIAAVMACPAAGSLEHLEALRVANGGAAPPLDNQTRWDARPRVDSGEVFRRALGTATIGATREQIRAAALVAYPSVRLQPDDQARLDEMGAVCLGLFEVAVFGAGERCVEVIPSREWWRRQMALGWRPAR